MSEQIDVTGELEDAGVLDGIRWAFNSAVDRTLADYSEETGHNAAWVGNTRHPLFCDRLDRVFQCGDYALEDGQDSSAGLDQLLATLTAKDIATMPKVAPGLVRRSNLSQSPGWLVGNHRFLITACPFGGVDSLEWARKSKTKQAVAMQRNPEPPPSLFDYVDDEHVDELAVLLLDATIHNFVVAHALDVTSRQRELVFGRSRMNLDGGDAWYWYQNLLSSQPIPGSWQPLTQPTGIDTVPDAPVRLRRKSGQQHTTNGQR